MVRHFAVFCIFSCMLRITHGADGMMYGNPPISGRTLTVEPRAFIFTHKPLPAGTADYFWFTSSGVNRKLYLQVWRPLAEDEEFLLVGQVFYQTDRNGTVQVTVPETSPRILTEAGDLVGFTSIEQVVGVTFNVKPFDEGSLLRTMMVEGIPVPGRTYSFGGSFFDKKFALSVHITQGVPKESSCEQDNGGCDHLCTILNGRPTCRCLEGFNLQLDLLTCSDVDECGEIPLVCGRGESCSNTPGSYTCVRTPPITTIVDTTTMASASGTNTGTVTGRGIADLFADPVMLTVHLWLFLLTILTIATLIVVCISWRRRVKFVYGSSLFNHFKNPSKLTTSLNSISVDKDGRL